MPQVSRIKLDTKTEDKLIEILEKTLSKISKKEEMSLFLKSLLTPTEKLMLAKRIAMVILLRQNLPDSKIATTLNVTRVTVSRMRYYLEARGEGFEIVDQILQKEEIAKEIKSFLTKLASYSVRAAGGRVKPEVF